MNAAKKEKWIRLGLIGYALILFALHAARSFDHCYTGDEAFTIRLSYLSLPDMLRATAEDVHPPLYYFVVKVVCKLLGHDAVALHIATLLPYALMLVLALTALYKLFGWQTSALFITFASLTDCAITYEHDIRMYSLGALLVLASFLALYGVLRTGRPLWYAAFALASLAAAYTHYYCLISVAFFYLVLLALAFFCDRRMLRPVWIVCGATVLGYLPWFFILLQSFQRTSADYWIPSLEGVQEYFGFLFSGRLQYLYVVVLLAGAAYTLWTARRQPRPRPEGAAPACNADSCWILAGLLSIGGTIAVGMGVSLLIRPMFLERYLFPVAAVAWLLLGVCLRKLRYQTPCALLLVVLLLLTGGHQYAAVTAKEQSDNRLLNTTLELTREALEPGDVFLSDITHFTWTLAEVYYPGVPCQSFYDEVFWDLDKDTTYWLVVTQQRNTLFLEALAEQGFQCELFLPDGHLGWFEVVIYRVTAE